jgi:hypothetical protein
MIECSSFVNSFLSYAIERKEDILLLDALTNDFLANIAVNRKVLNTMFQNSLFYIPSQQGKEIELYHTTELTEVWGAIMAIVDELQEIA